MAFFDIRLFTISASLFTALACLIIVFLDIIKEGKKQRQLKVNLSLYFGSHILTQLCFLMYFYNAPLLIWFNWMFMLNILLVPIFLYTIIFRITRINRDEHFSKFHYLIPVLLSVCMLVLSVVTPVEDQLQTLKGNGTYVGGSYLFFIFSNKLIFRLIFNVIYVTISFRRLVPYRKYIENYSANESKSSLRWVIILLLFIVSLIFVPLYGVFVSRSGLASSLVVYFQSSVIIIQYSYLAFHIIKRNYVLLESAKLEEKIPLSTSSEDKINSMEYLFPLKKNVLSKEQFNKYMETEKPYLEASLKITDLAEKIGINRTYISSFINTEYKMNFSNYINNLRYNEYKILRNTTKYKDKSNAELSEIVGFGSYRSYMRFSSINGTNTNLE